jgi:hypothetical protein
MSIDTNLENESEALDFSFSDIFNDIILKNKNKTDEELYKIITENDLFNNKDNLITYCKDCHFYKIHKFKRKSAAKP